MLPPTPNCPAGECTWSDILANFANESKEPNGKECFPGSIAEQSHAKENIRRLISLKMSCNIKAAGPLHDRTGCSAK
jgi:hypothetical protein